MSVSTRSERPVLAALPALRERLSLILGSALIALLLIWLLINFIKTPGSFTLIFLQGLTDGSIYALVALGYTLVYGIIELINFAHGDVFMWGTMLCSTFAYSWLHLNEHPWYVWVPAIIGVLFAVMFLCAAMNVTIERIAYRPLRNAPKLAPLITAIGMS